MGNIKKRTPNTGIHELTPQTLVWRLDYLWVRLARTNPSSSNSGPFAQTGKSIRKTLFRSRTYNTTVGEHT